MLPYSDVLRSLPQLFPDQALGGRFNALCGDGLAAVLSGNANGPSMATTTKQGCAAFRTAAEHPVAEQQLKPQPFCSLATSASPRDTVLSAKPSAIGTVKPA
jgi:hypothetical protein